MAVAAVLAALEVILGGWVAIQAAAFPAAAVVKRVVQAEARGAR